MTIRIDPIFAHPRVSISDRFQKPTRPYVYGASPVHLRPSDVEPSRLRAVTTERNCPVKP